MSYVSEKIKYYFHVSKVSQVKEETTRVMPHAMCDTYIHNYIASYIARSYIRSHYKLIYHRFPKI